MRKLMRYPDQSRGLKTRGERALVYTHAHARARLYTYSKVGVKNNSFRLVQHVPQRIFHSPGS
jgi:hypothetical protein